MCYNLPSESNTYLYSKSNQPKKPYLTPLIALAGVREETELLAFNPRVCHGHHHEPMRSYHIPCRCQPHRHSEDTHTQPKLRTNVNAAGVNPGSGHVENVTSHA